MRDKLWASILGLMGLIAAGSGSVAFDLSKDLRLEVALNQKKDHVIIEVLGPEIQRQMNLCNGYEQ